MKYARGVVFEKFSEYFVLAKHIFLHYVNICFWFL